MTLTQTKQELRLGNDADLNEMARIATEHVVAFNYRYDPTGHEPLLCYVDALIGQRQQVRKTGPPHVIIWLEENTERLSPTDHDLIDQATNVITSTIKARYHCSVNAELLSTEP